MRQQPLLFGTPQELRALAAVAPPGPEGSRQGSAAATGSAAIRIARKARHAAAAAEARLGEVAAERDELAERLRALRRAGMSTDPPDVPPGEVHVVLGLRIWRSGSNHIRRLLNWIVSLLGYFHLEGMAGGKLVGVSCAFK